MSSMLKKIFGILVQARIRRNGSFEIVGGYGPDDDTIVDWAAVKDLAALDDF